MLTEMGRHGELKEFSAFMIKTASAEVLLY